MTDIDEVEPVDWEVVVRSVDGVRDLFPVSALPGAPRTRIHRTVDGPSLDVRIAIDRDVRAVDLVGRIAAAIRDVTPTDQAPFTLHIEIALID